MKSFSIAAAAALCAAMAFGSANAQATDDSKVKELQPVAAAGDAGAWKIYTNGNIGYGCLAAGKFSDGTEVRMGINNDNNQRYIGLFNDAWTAPLNMEATLIEIDIDGKVYKTVGTKVNRFKRHGAIAYFEGDGFLRDLATRGTMTFRQDGKVMTVIKLADTKVAVDAIQRCKAIPLQDLKDLF